MTTPWRTNDTGNSLRKHTCTCRHLDCHSIFVNVVINKQLACKASRLCFSVSSSKGVAWRVHVATREIWMSGWQISIKSPSTSSLEAKASIEIIAKLAWINRRWRDMAQAPSRQFDKEHGFCSESCRSMLVLPREGRSSNLLRRLHHFHPGEISSWQSN